MTFEELLTSGCEFVVETGSLEETTELCNRYHAIWPENHCASGKWVDMRFKHEMYQGWNSHGDYAHNSIYRHVPRYAWSDICDTADEAENEDLISGLLSLLE